MKAPGLVAARCLGLELLAQRLALETDEESALAERETARKAWAGRTQDFGADLFEEEEALMQKTVGSLGDDDHDVLEDAAEAAPVLLWALGRTEARPTFETLAAEVLEQSGILGDGSASVARKTVAEAKLRDEREIGEGEAAYRNRRGKAKDTDDPEKIFAEVAAHYLTWVLEEEQEWALLDDDEAGPSS